MTWFKYTYLTTNEIFEKINYISSGNLIWIFFIVISILTVVFINNYLFPTILFCVENYKKEKKKREKKLLLRQIQLQREVENEIEKSL